MINKNQTSSPLQLITIRANSDIPAHRFINARGDLCAHTENPIGISEISWNAGDTMSVISYGTALIETLEAINIGEKVGVSNSSGKACRKTNEGDWVATALSSGASGSIIKVKLVV